jgi:hypothetical protein
MNLSPTESRRIMMLDIQTVETDSPQSDHIKYTGTEVITGIQVTVDDGGRVAVATFSDAAEIDLLRNFWGAVQPDDMFYGCQIFDRLFLLRRRTWACGLIPSRELSLSMVYRHDVVDTDGVGSNASDAGHRSAEALVSVLGLRTRAPNAENILFVAGAECRRWELPDGSASTAAPLAPASCRQHPRKGLAR